MPSPTQAPPEVVQQLSELPEYELTPDGKVLPVQNQVAASPQASQVGAGTEAVGSPAEPAQPVQPTTPTIVPPAQVVGQPQATTPVVQVIQPQPAQAPAPEQPPTQVETTKEPTTEELAAAEARLDAFLEEQISTRLEAALRDRQSGFDKRAAQLDRQLQEASTREKTMRDEIRQLQTQGLSEEERTKLLSYYEQEDERTELNSYRSQLVDYNKYLMVQSLMFEFSGYGVKQEAIEQFESPEEMEAYCYEQKANFLETQINQAAAQPVAQPAVAQPVPQQPVQQPQPQVPAGALAPVDLGGGGAVAPGPQFSEEANPEALRQNLRQMRWESVRINR